MKKIIAIPAILIILSFINYALIIEPSAASIVAPVQGSPSFSINSIEVTEGIDAQAVFTVTFEYQGGFREFTTTVNYSTSNGSATAPGDYTNSAGTVTFPPGETPGGRVTMTVSIPILDDEEQEGDETFTVALSNPNFQFILSPPGTCTIHDNDNGPSRMAILDTQVTEGDSGTVDATLRVGLNRRSNSDVLVDYTTESFSAVAGSDYVARSETLTIPAGSISREITIPIIGDTLPECPQRFFVRLSNARGAEITDDEGVCTIIDNDDPEQITVCAQDTPIQGNEFTSTITVDRDIIADNLSVRLHISHANISTFTAKVNLDLQKDSSSDSRLFPGGLSIPANSSIGTTCSPVPDFAITDNAGERIQDHDGEAPYIGSWLSSGRRSLLISDIEGTNARGTYRLVKIQFNSIADSITVRLNCWCLVITAPCEGLKLEPARATLPVFDNISFDLDEEDSTLGQPYGGHYVKAALNTAAGPASNVPVTFTIRDRGGEGDVISTQVINTDERGRALLHYLDWVPGEQTIEARAEIDGAVYTDIARVTFLNPCAATQAVQSASNAEAALNSMREFRDSKLAKSKRGRKYARSYYRLSSEAVPMMMLNPLMVLRSQQMIERYMPIVRDLSSGKDVTLTKGDLDEIDGFLNQFASKGSPQLKQTVKGLCEDLRNPDVHKEFGITVTPGPRREMPARSQFLSTNQMSLGGMLAGACAILVFGFTGKRRRFLKRHGKQFLVVILAMAVVGGQGSAVSYQPSAISHKSLQYANFAGTANFFRLDAKHSSFGDSRLTLPAFASNSRQQGLSQVYNKLPLRFEANHGQADGQIKFISRNSDYNLFLMPNEAALALTTRGGGDAATRGFTDDPVSASPRPRVPASNSVLRMKLADSNPNPRIRGLDELPTKTNYFIGKDRSNWRADVPSYAKVKYEDVYKGVDMVY
ncbi:MAG: hypothetical protein L0229_20835, partial [Blastocatellia bacterium]|nr:hypothetical protein [Blastocatellia bacterium]